MISVSRDKSLTEYILNDNNVDVVMSSGSFKTLVCDVEKETWFLPVTVRKVFTADGKVKNVVFVDKKLPRNYMSKHDMNLAHAKITTKWAYILDSHPKLKGPPPTKYPAERNVVAYDDLMVSELNEIQLQKADFQDSKNSFENPHDMKKEFTPLVGISSGSQDLKEGTEERKTAESIEQRSQAPPCFKADLNSKSPSTNFQDQRAKLTPRSKLGNNLILNPSLVYNLFNLHKSNEDPMLKIEEKRRLNILVRSRCDASLAYLKFNKRFISDAHISTKVEFQPEYGASKLTRSELLREYIDLRLRPNNVLLRARSVGHTKEFMVQEVKRLQDLSPIPGLVTNNLFDPLYSVLTKLIDLKEGQYLVCHGPTAGFFADIMAQSDRNAVKGFCMESYLMTLAEASLQLPPPEIDPNVLTQIHYRHKTPPAVFWPKTILRSNNPNVSMCPKPALSVKEKKRLKRKRKTLKNKKKKDLKKLAASLSSGD